MEPEYELALLALARVAVASSHSLRQALGEVATITAGTMGIGRVSIWMFTQNSDGLRCEYLHQPGSAAAYEGTLLLREHFPQYMQALDIQRAVPIADMSNPAILDEFLEPYMRPLNITAMLDAPIYRAGQVIGVVCHEQIGAARPWTNHDERLAAHTADTVARLYEEAARVQAELMLHTHQAHALALDRIASLGQMAAGIAHDFRNILHAVLTYADIIGNTAPEDEQIQELVKRQVSAIERGAELAHQLMELGRKDSGQPHVMDVVDVVEQFLPTLSKAAGSTVQIRTEFADNLCQVFIDNQQLERVLLNLTLNARDAMPDGKGTIHLRVYEAHRPIHTGDNALYVTIEVADDGCGMDDITLRKLFQPYFTTKGSRGTGLGMTVIEQIITLAGGFVDVESSPGKGTRLRLRLPRIGRASAAA